MTFGPFDITPERIEALGDRFTIFFNRLLQKEAADHQLHGFLLGLNVNEDATDGGVDATTTGAPETDYLPAGTTAWQFKRTNFSETQCVAEFEGASWAQQIVRDGGSYIIAIGGTLPARNVEDRRKKIAAKAVELGLMASDDLKRIRVYDTNKIASWASKFPSLAVSQVSGGPGSVAIDFEAWSGKYPHQFHWSPDQTRRDSIESLRAAIRLESVVELRIQGEPGIGKTRMVLEALRDDGLAPLVAYVADERAVGGELLEHLIEDGRSAILVVDECPPQSHLRLVGMLPAKPNVKLVTIGETGSVAVRAALIPIGDMGSDDIEAFLRPNFPTLSPEARRFVAGNCRGNIRWAISLADHVARTPDAQAADLIGRNAIEEFVTTLLPEGRDFLLAAALALFERIGWDRELRTELEILAAFTGASTEEFESVAIPMIQRDQMVLQGRYRAVSPHPLAVFLAAEAWRQYSNRIVSELLPDLTDEMAYSLFRRVADLGRFEPVRSVLPSLLASSGPFGSLEAMESNGLGRLLTQLAIVLPDEVTAHLDALVTETDIDHLRALVNCRRDLVWTLEKLAWNTRTFEQAADCLLRLALAENERYGNNATGTWVSLFGTMLPSTAATTMQRINYLRRKAASEVSEIRRLAVRGASGTLSPHESVAVSAEIQGGVLPEPRGMPSTYGEAAEYRKAMIDLLNVLRTDPDEEVASVAQAALLGGLHPYIDDPFIGDHLMDVLVAFRGDGLLQLRSSCEHLISLRERYGPEDTKLADRLRELLTRLPDPSPAETLEVLVQSNRWDLADGELKERVVRTVASLVAAGDSEFPLDLLNTKVKADWELGYAIAVARLPDDPARRLLDSFAVNPAALVGFLNGRVADGDAEAFNEFLRVHQGELSLRDQLAISVRGPINDASRRRVIDGLRELGVIEGVSVLFGWSKNLVTDEALSQLRDWASRLASVGDYEAVIDWLSLYLYPGEEIPEQFRSDVWALVTRRREFPGLSHARWDWNRLAALLLADHTIDLAKLILDLIHEGEVMVLSQDDESQLLSRCATLDPENTWGELAGRLTSGEAWRIQMQIRGWLLNSFPIETIVRWVNKDLARAQLVASIASPGDVTPTPVALYLLENFGEDDTVRSSLMGQFMSGFWTGPESSRISSQIQQLSGWRSNSDYPREVRKWAADLSTQLEQRLQEVRVREAERGF